jgi:hypothetical protein
MRYGDGSGFVAIQHEKRHLVAILLSTASKSGMLRHRDPLLSQIRVEDDMKITTFFELFGKAERLNRLRDQP